MTEEEKQEPQADVDITNDGTVWLFGPNNDRAEQWMLLMLFPVTRLGGAFVVEHRFGPTVAQALAEHKFSVTYKDGPGNPFSDGSGGAGGR